MTLWTLKGPYLNVSSFGDDRSVEISRELIHTRSPSFKGSVSL